MKKYTRQPIKILEKMNKAINPTKLKKNITNENI